MIKIHRTQRDILAHIKGNLNATVEEVQSACKISTYSVAVHHINRLLAMGLLKRCNRWEVDGKLPYTVREGKPTEKSKAKALSKMKFD